jgi:hypothetical protein
MRAAFGDAFGVDGGSFWWGFSRESCLGQADEETGRSPP